MFGQDFANGPALASRWGLGFSTGLTRTWTVGAVSDEEVKWDKEVF
jgi:hypothetical protein